jgi:uncharacterized protein DUF4185
MKSRRAFLTHAAATAFVTATSVAIEGAEESQRGPYPSVVPGRRPRIASVIRRENTLLRLGGDFSGVSMTWTADDRQLGVFGDSSGFLDLSKRDPYYTARLVSVSGKPPKPIFEDVASFPDEFCWRIHSWGDFHKGAVPYYGKSLLAVDGRIYVYLMTLADDFQWACKNDWSSAISHFAGAKLIYSPDGGRTWCNEDGSKPVVWELEGHRSQKNMIFWSEPKDAFAGPILLQMGKDYRGNRDGYVYIYGNGTADPSDEAARTSGLLVIRVPKTQVLDREAFEYFGGLKADGSAHWVKDIREQSAVLALSDGWGTDCVVHNDPLGIYMLTGSRVASIMSGRKQSTDQSWSPSSLGIWVAPQPWGPWTQVHEESTWLPGGDHGARPFSPQIAPKWISKNGKSFWLVWSDLQYRGSGGVGNEDDLYGRSCVSEEIFVERRRRWREHHPYWAFNSQRVDLVLR